MRHDRFSLARDLAWLLKGKDNRNLRTQRNNLKRLYRDTLRDAQGKDPLEKSLLSGVVRERWDENGETLTEYRIYKGDFSPHEISELVDSEWESIHSPYDCTGRLFTENIHARQTPVGLVFIHRMGVDV